MKKYDIEFSVSGSDQIVAESEDAVREALLYALSRTDFDVQIDGLVIVESDDQSGVVDDEFDSGFMIVPVVVFDEDYDLTDDDDPYADDDCEDFFEDDYEGL